MSIHDLSAAEINSPEFLTYVLQELGLEFGLIELLQQDQQQRYQKALEQLRGIAYLIDLENHCLRIQTFPEGEELKCLSLSGGSWLSDTAPLLMRYEPWGSALCYLNRHHGQIETLQKIKPDHCYGLVISAETSFFYLPDLLSLAVLPETRICHGPVTPKSGRQDPVYDLYLSEDRQYLCISHRQGGTLHILSTLTQEWWGEVRIRQPGSSKALNLSFDLYEPRVYLTDNQSPTVYSLELPSLQLETIAVGLQGQIFGNLVRSPDIRYLCILVLKPGVSLQYLNIETGEFDEEIALKGNFLSLHQIDPCDLIALSPMHHLLFVMTSHNEPTPLTPGISVIDLDQVQTLDFHSIPYALRDHTKPVDLVFALANPLLNEQKSALELLLQQGLLTPEKLAELQAKRQENLDTPAETRGLGIGGVPALTPLPADPIRLDPAKALPAILYLLGYKLYQQTEIDLQAHPDVLARFETLSEEYRQRLEHYDSVEVTIEALPGEQKLETVLTRQDVLSLMQEVSEATGQLSRPPYTCPACAQPLKGSWNCPSCYFELESPERAERRKRASLDSLGVLPPFHLLLTDPKRRRLLILDDHKTIDWELKAHEVVWEGHEVHFWYALWHSRQSLLVVDRHHSQIFECSPTGIVSWAVDQSLSPAHVLKHPVKASYYSEMDPTKELVEHFLIVDQGNHRVLVINRQQEIIWQYGIQGEAGNGPGYLHTPSDLQRTPDGTYLIADSGNHRVIEVQDQEIIRVFSWKQGLHHPIYAQRLLDQDTLIVDAGNYRVIEVDLSGEIMRESFYYTHDMPEELRMEMPSRVYRREKQSVVLMDEDKVIEILPLRQTLIWSSLLKHLARRTEIRYHALDKREKYIEAFEQYQLPSLEELLERLRESQRLQPPTDLAERILERFHALLEARRESDRQRSEQIQVKHINDAPLLDISIYVIDRVNHQIVRIDHAGQDHWHFGTAPNHKLLRPGHIFETPQSLLITDTHHNRVLEVSLTNQEVLQIFGETPGTLFRPRSACRTLQGTTLVADQGHRRLVEFNAHGKIIWEYQKVREILHPYYAEALGQGTVLFVDQGLHMVKEINRKGELIWSYGQPSRIGTDENQLNSPEFATRLHSGTTLIADTGNHRVIEVSPQRKILWEFSGYKKYQLYRPIACQRMSNGHTLIVYDNSRSMLEVNREGEACWYFELGTKPMIHWG